MLGLKRVDKLRNIQLKICRNMHLNLYSIYVNSQNEVCVQNSVLCYTVVVCSLVLCVKCVCEKKSERIVSQNKLSSGAHASLNLRPDSQIILINAILLTTLVVKVLYRWQSGLSIKLLCLEIRGKKRSYLTRVNLFAFLQSSFLTNRQENLNTHDALGMLPSKATPTNLPWIRKTRVKSALLQQEILLETFKQGHT